MQIWIRFIVISVLSLVITGACSGSDEDANTSNDDQDMPVTEETEQNMATDDVEVAGDQTEESVQEDANTNDRLIIYEGDLYLETTNYQETVSAIERQTEEAGGYLIESSTRQSGDDRLPLGHMVVRVPVNDFFSFIDRIGDTGAEVIEEQTRGRDVTEEYVDLESRLRTQQTVEERLLTFMEEADSTEALLDVSNQLTDIQQEIESIQGRINYLDNRVDYGTLHIEISEREEAQLQDRETLNTWDRATDQLMGTLNGLMSAASGLAVFVIGFSPIFVPLIAIGILFWFFKRRKLKNDVEKGNNEDHESRS
ncbi:DUF4349 domain-containing protein [Salisediminibacterium selenitireducens]|uniref:DUF4349 domain-containing protein n=1 Tax=Bacillus selenitireducens (strain ATCC 700615 / DSM 15326 / MLS10) TaxID=439292 RepID=D6XUN4_BACIE|nr:DUF4349 domain-containing protein [Salisediminibacterium selenitireducens]ADH99520.1 hypothetical protein Bsel_2016 [[Bacillus] selenitireducens MLS10]